MLANGWWLAHEQIEKKGGEGGVGESPSNSKQILTNVDINISLLQGLVEHSVTFLNTFSLYNVSLAWTWSLKGLCESRS